MLDISSCFSNKVVYPRSLLFSFQQAEQHSHTLVVFTQWCEPCSGSRMQLKMFSSVQSHIQTHLDLFFCLCGVLLRKLCTHIHTNCFFTDTCIYILYTLYNHILSKYYLQTPTNSSSYMHVAHTHTVGDAAAAVILFIRKCKHLFLLNFDFLPYIFFVLCC